MANLKPHIFKSITCPRPVGPTSLGRDQGRSARLFLVIRKYKNSYYFVCFFYHSAENLKRSKFFLYHSNNVAELILKSTLMI